jgi:hypothetical protein
MPRLSVCYKPFAYIVDTDSVLYDGDEVSDASCKILLTPTHTHTHILHTHNVLYSFWVENAEPIIHTTNTISSFLPLLELFSLSLSLGLFIEQNRYKVHIEEKEILESKASLLCLGNL